MTIDTLMVCIVKQLSCAESVLSDCCCLRVEYTRSNSLIYQQGVEISDLASITHDLLEHVLEVLDAERSPA